MKDFSGCVEGTHLTNMNPVFNSEACLGICIST